MPGNENYIKWLFTQILEGSVRQGLICEKSTGRQLLDIHISSDCVINSKGTLSIHWANFLENLQSTVVNYSYCDSNPILGITNAKKYTDSSTGVIGNHPAIDQFSSKNFFDTSDNKVKCFVAKLFDVFESRMVSTKLYESTHHQICDKLQQNCVVSQARKCNSFNDPKARNSKKTKKPHSYKRQSELSELQSNKPLKNNYNQNVVFQEENLPKKISIEDDRELLCHSKSALEASDAGYSSRCSSPLSPSLYGDSSSDHNSEKLSTSEERKYESRSPSPTNSVASSHGSNDSGYAKYKKSNSNNKKTEHYEQNNANLQYNVSKRNGHLQKCHYNESFSNKQNFPSNRKYEKRSNNNVIYHGGVLNFTYNSYRANPSPKHCYMYQDPSHSRQKMMEKQVEKDLNYATLSGWDVRKTLSRWTRQIESSAGIFFPREKHSAGWREPLFEDKTGTPRQLLNGSEWDGLSQQIWHQFVLNQQKVQTFKAKILLKERISEVIHNVLPGSCLYVVGSSLSGFGSNSSDVDMCLMISEMELDQKFGAQNLLKVLQRELNNAGFAENMILIRAKVPILRFRDAHTGFEVDLNCNNSVGIRNTHLLNAYSQLDWRVRPLVLVVKLWAQINEIGTARNKTISSYSIVLMVIHYLQCGVTPNMLPSLQKAFPDRFNYWNRIFLLPTTERLPNFASNNKQCLGELFVGFLDYFANKFRYNEDCISVRLGETLPIDSCRYNRKRWNDPRMWNYLCIEEPFDFTSTASAMYDPDVFEWVKSVFKHSYECVSKQKDLSQIFPVKIPQFNISD